MTSEDLSSPVLVKREEKSYSGKKERSEGSTFFRFLILSVRMSKAGKQKQD